MTPAERQGVSTAIMAVPPEPLARGVGMTVRSLEAPAAGDQVRAAPKPIASAISTATSSIDRSPTSITRSPIRRSSMIP